MNLKRYHLFHFHPTPKDIHRPNFIFSSDIPDRVNQLWEVYNHYKQNNHLQNNNLQNNDHQNGEIDTQLHKQRVKHTDDVDLAQLLHIEFTINVELNTLLNRNKSLRPTDLIKDNLIFLAKANEDKVSVNFISNCMNYENKLTVNPKRFLDNEVFVVTLNLRLLNFVVADTEIQIDFLKDENFGILLLCDRNFIVQLETYIKILFTNECHIQQALASSSSNILTNPRAISGSSNATSIDSNSSIIEEFPMNEISGTETTLEISEHEILSSDKHLDSSFDFLYAKDDDDNNDGQDDIMTLIDKKPSNDTHKLNFANLIKSNNLNTIKEQQSDDNFIGNMNNLRHNEEHDITEPEYPDSNPQSPTLRSPIRSISIDDDIRSPKSPPNGTDLNFPASIKLRPSKTELRRPSTNEEDFDFDSITRKLSRSNFMPPPPHKPLKKTSSSFTLDISDSEDFSYGGPSYIKGDKKFKFIKVGKVQKYVNLFEEKVTEETGSARTTRPSTPSRPGSPTKLD